jgi:hypothetical protein
MKRGRPTITVDSRYAVSGAVSTTGRQRLGKRLSETEYLMVRESR